ncbi:MAG: IPExxxVDY family protein [Bacteroidota bacterium]
MSKILSFDYEYEHDYILIGVHTSLEDYRVAYFLNEALNLKFKRYKEDLDFESKECSFSLYVYEDEVNYNTWSLINNKQYFLEDEDLDPGNLFQNEPKVSYLIPEKNKVDFFIKISGNIDQGSLERILQKTKDIKNVITLYTVEPNKLKSKDFLIF